MAVALIDNWQNYTRHQDSRGIVVQTFEANRWNSNAFDYFSDSFAVGDTVVFGYVLRFWGIRLTVETPMAADSITLDVSGGNATYVSVG